MAEPLRLRFLSLRAMRNPHIAKKMEMKRTARKALLWLVRVLVPDEFHAGAVVDAHGCRPCRSHAEDSPSYVRRTVVRPLMNARRESARSDLLSQGQNPRALGAIFREAQLNGARSNSSASQGKTEQIHRAGLAERSGRIEITGIKTQRQILCVLAGKVPAGNCPDDLGNGNAAEVRGEREASVSQAGTGSGRGGEVARDAQAKTIVWICGLVEGSKLAILVEFKHRRLGPQGQRCKHR